MTCSASVAWATVTEVAGGGAMGADLDGEGSGDAKVRYLGIDTPETYFGVECYGPEAKQRNREMVGGLVGGPMVGRRSRQVAVSQGLTGYR